MDHLANVHSRFGRLNFDSVTRSASSTDPSSNPSRNVPIVNPHNGHTTSSPISMPQASLSGRIDIDSKDSLENIGSGGVEDGTFRDPDFISPIEQANRARKSSIAFDPHVKADGGKQFPLQAPLPKPIKPDSTAKKEYFENNPSPARSFTWPEQDSHYREGSTRYRNGDGSIRDRRTTARQFLSPTPLDSPDHGPERVASLTSDSTMSPLSDEFYTPPPQSDAFGDFFFSPYSGSPLSDRLQGSSPIWPARTTGHSARNKSYTFEPRTRSRSRRAQSDRSASPRYGGSSQLSPANLFLNSLNNSRAQPVEPDSEGQEVGSYVLGKQIGYGGFSVVKEAITIEGGIEIKRAVKVVRKKAREVDCENDKVQADFDHEVSLWRCISHPHILPLVAVYDTPFATFAFTKLVKGGSLYDLIKANRHGVSARLAQRYSFQLACALRYLHEDMRIMHRDVKLENCLVDMSVRSDEGGNLLLCDFGMAEFIKNQDDEEDDDDSSNDGLYFNTVKRSRKSSSASTNSASLPSTTTSLMGSLEYASPEMVSGQDTLSSSTCPPHYTPAADMWAFGVVVYVLHTGNLPFSHNFQPKLMNKILSGEYDEDKLRKCRGLVEAGCSQDVLEVVKGCLAIRPEERWDIRKVLESSWFGQYGDESP
ncbi:kinase-like protein [Choiromyces venosus 120613-1]|uniref:Kinase-like protein n=1 Tax=Choiromyces venosus 120613-1 TaxID=1336337 RepID=A0A3N4JWR2_9PEZI|nr:kinase-like protein [Choiromyces venosus 120613-1]